MLVREGSSAGGQVLSTRLQKLGHAGGDSRVGGGGGGEKEGGRGGAHVAATDKHVDGLGEGAPHEVVARGRMAWLQ